MKNLMIASVAIAMIGLAGCAKEDKMMKDEAAMEKEVMTEPSVVEEEARPAAPAENAEFNDANSGGDTAMMDLCASKGGSIGEWPGEDSSTKTCDTPDGNSYPLASLTSFEAFQ